MGRIIFKENFLIYLKQRLETFKPGQREALARYLLKNNTPLSQEHDKPSDATLFLKRKEEYSHETKSMHKALKMLLKHVDSQDVLTVKKSCFSGTQITLFAQASAEAQTFTFSRYRRFL